MGLALAPTRRIQLAAQAVIIMRCTCLRFFTTIKSASRAGLQAKRVDLENRCVSGRRI
ncbi:hypothetical protein YSA_03575 [Pseudomonas putida ND6]|uniref:Uncharacterized protein n=1 Tax=Pseudomonas putida ND6 TaxID=231023 RepID=I3UT77_PSEPU|nr:hypothetical protein YSA_03575 [Pseudomonas putida ND6]